MAANDDDDQLERPPLVRHWNTVYAWVLVSLAVSIALLRVLAGFGT